MFLGGHYWNGSHDSGILDGVLEYDPEEDYIRTVGHMTVDREYHAISVVRAADFYQWCH